jgi:hypothetical protein
MEYTTKHVLRTKTEVKKHGEIIAEWFNNNATGKAYYFADIRLTILGQSGFQIRHTDVTGSKALLQKYFPDLASSGMVPITWEPVEYRLPPDGWPSRKRKGIHYRMRLPPALSAIYPEGLGKVRQAALTTTQYPELLTNLKECPACNKFFYAQRQRKRFCSQKCQESFYWKGPEGRKYRREAMRKYRENQKRLNKQALRKARAAH